MITSVISFETPDNLSEVKCTGPEEIEPQTDDVIHLRLCEWKQVKLGFTPRGVWLQSQNS